MPKLSDEQTTQELRRLPGWQSGGDEIKKKFQFGSFMEAIDFVNQVAKIAEAADHHPDILINYSRVTFSCSTHSEGGVTEKDVKLAGDIERLFKDRQE